MNKTEKEQITIRIPMELKDKLQKAAYELGVSFNGFITSCLWKALEEKQSRFPFQMMKYTFQERILFLHLWTGVPHMQGI